MAGATGYVYLWDNYQSTHEAMAASMYSLQTHMSCLKTSLSKMDMLEQRIRDLESSSASQAQLEKRRQELLKLIVRYQRTRSH